MAKIHFNSAIARLHGAIDGWVYKHYKDKRGLVVSRRPDMSRIKPSAAQRAQRKRMEDAGAFHRSVKADPVLLKKYRAIAKRKQITLSAATMGEFLRIAAKGKK